MSFLFDRFRNLGSLPQIAVDSEVPGELPRLRADWRPTLLGGDVGVSGSYQHSQHGRPDWSAMFNLTRKF